MAQTLTYYPLGNAQTMQLELNNKKRILFDFASKHDSKDASDKRCKVVDEFDGVKKFDVVLFTHAHEDHVKGAAEFFNMEYSGKNDEGVKIEELWLSSAFVTDNPSCEDSRVIRQEARARLKAGEAVKVFGHSKELSEWLEGAGITEDSVEHLIIHAGHNILHDLGDEVSFFLHAPFSDDCDDVTDKNDPSVVMQVRLSNGERETNLFITGDVTCKVLDEIVSRTCENNNEEYLKWDLYDIPHHCSDTGLCMEKTDEEVVPMENIKWLLQQSGTNAHMVASCNPLSESDTPPPSAEAVEVYETYSKEDVTFRITMETPKESAPKPMMFTINENGITYKPSTSHAFLSAPAPRAG
jgi:beta-lactamase superfamily II metal-dependent hydrolase